MSEYRLDVHLPAEYAADALRRDALAGLTSVPKSLPPKWFYDKVGSALFEQITKLPEYYPTRAEREILETYAAHIASASDTDTLVELGSGSSIKTRLLIDAMIASQGLQNYVALDVSEDALREAADSLTHDYPGLALHALVADFTNQLHLLPTSGKRLVIFLGGTLGNFEPESRADFLQQVRDSLALHDRFLIGADLVKSPDVLVPAYDDSAGVTAAFNRNVLEVLNRGLDANFAVDQFDHVAMWDATNEWMEMSLRSCEDQDVRVGGLDLDVSFAAGESMRTEISAKFRRERLETELDAAGFSQSGWWTDSGERFSLSLWAPR